MLAFGLARLGEDQAAKHLANLAEVWLAEAIVEHKDVHIVLMDAFRYRVQQALEGKPAVGPLPAEVLEFAEQLAYMPRYVIDSLRMRSRILEPHEKVNAFRNSFMGVLSDFDKALNRIPDILDRAQMEKECQRLLREAKNTTQRFYAVKAALTVAPRLGAEFAMPLLQETSVVCAEPIAVSEQAKLLERALFMAAHFNQAETAQILFARFQEVVRSDALAAHPKEFNELIVQCFRGLRKLGMQDEMRGLLQGLTVAITRGKSLPSLRQSDDWPKLVRRLLHVAAGHFYFGDESKGRELLDEARTLLLKGDLRGRDQAELACTYIGTLGQTPIGLAMAAIDELLQHLRGVFDNYASHTHYSASKLEVIEAIVMTVVTEEFAMGQVGRRWLEDDEYLVRQRIHRDVEAAQHGESNGTMDLR
jgi:cellulose synthase operon protein C